MCSGPCNSKAIWGITNYICICVILFTGSLFAVHSLDSLNWTSHEMIVLLVCYTSRQPQVKVASLLSPFHKFRRCIKSISQCLKFINWSTEFCGALGLSGWSKGQKVVETECTCCHAGESAAVHNKTRVIKEERWYLMILQTEARDGGRRWRS